MNERVYRNIDEAKKAIKLITYWTRDSAIKYASYALNNYCNLEQIPLEALSKISIIEYVKPFIFNNISVSNDIKNDIKDWYNELRENLKSCLSIDDQKIHNRFIEIRNTEWAHSDEASFSPKFRTTSNSITIPISRSTDYSLSKSEFQNIIEFSKKQKSLV